MAISGKKIGLALSGGCFRAARFGLGECREVHSVTAAAEPLA
jgi:hypothetical protein